MTSQESSTLQTGLSSTDRGAYASWLARVARGWRAPERTRRVSSGPSPPQEPGHRVGLAATEKALYETVDAGLTWTLWDTALPAAPVDLLASSPADPSRLYAATPYGVGVSLDGARSWQSPAEVGPDGIARAVAIAVDPDDALSTYVLTQAGTVFQSGDGGRTWERHSEIAESLRTGPLSLAIASMTDGSCGAVPPVRSPVLRVRHSGRRQAGLLPTLRARARDRSPCSHPETLARC